jgi:uncharacterized membrane protein
VNYSKHRIEALSDGVFAIAMTLLILDLKVPVDVAPGQLDAALRANGHEWISFVVTFALAAIFWTFQHRVFDVLERMGRENLVLTFLFLGFVSVLPFSTSLWGHHIKEPLAFVLYFLNQFALAAVLTAKIEVARVKGHLKLGPETDSLRVRLYSMCAVMATGTLSVALLPLNRVWIPVCALALVMNMLRKVRERRLKRLAAGTVPTLPAT